MMTRGTQAAVQVDDMEAALDYLRRMFDDMLEPDVRLYNTLSTCLPCPCGVS